MNSEPSHIYEFGPFRLDPAQRLLSREGKAVPLKPKAFDLLYVLISRPDRVLKKEELMQEIWPDSFVEENNLADNIYKLRKALGDGENGSQYIETVPKHGYRFVAEVTQHDNSGLTAAIPQVTSSILIEGSEGDDTSVAATPPEALRSRSADRRFHPLALLIGMFLLLSVVAIWWITFHQERETAPTSTLRVVPITSLPGFIGWPTLSPDGKQVAFVWAKESGERDIFVKLIDVGDPLQLTFGPGIETDPVWSPDGRFIAFIRRPPGSKDGNPEPGEIYTVPALGGPAVKVADAFAGGGRSLDWSPDGKFFAVIDSKLRQDSFSTDSPQDPSSIFIIRKETGERRRLTFPPPRTVGDGGLAISPDGKMIAFIRRAGVGIGELYVIPFEGGEPRRLTFDNTAPGDLTWTRDGREIVFTSLRAGTAGLWSVSPQGSEPKPFVAIGPDAVCPSISRGRNSLVYLQGGSHSDVWRIERTGAKRNPGRPTPLISSRNQEGSARYSPDGKKIVFASGRSGSSDIWICNSDGADPVQLTTSAHPVAGTPRWSPTGSQIAFGSAESGSTDIYVVNAEGGALRRLTEEPSEDVRPSWSQDGRWIYFGSNRSGTWQVWKRPTEGGTPQQVTVQGGREAIESPNGQFLYYWKGGKNSAGIWRVPVGGGAEVPVLDRVSQGDWDLLDQGIYFINRKVKPHGVIQFFSFATKQVTQIAVLHKPVPWGPPVLSVSPDGTRLLYSTIETTGTDIILVENFR